MLLRQSGAHGIGVNMRLAIVSLGCRQNDMAFTSASTSG
jgi:hypothetical protein